ncbi:hypothetical protein Taro_010228 [Colocasia esculenta]|uniref:Uncharacterized protein n=1 Tax=Colocasia esculenta TaxID=4460 RepID=A0A843U6A1_COLES|nr:hypothetical protein [Colocasia esculenta]
MDGCQPVRKQHLFDCTYLPCVADEEEDLDHLFTGCRFTKGIWSRIVDSIKWVRSDSIVIGCVQINENDEEVDYMVQVITTEGAGIPEACSKPVVVTFSDLFHGIVDDIVPTGGIVANRKNTDDHVVLLSWSADGDRKRPVALEFEQEKFIPRIELQEPVCSRETLFKPPEDIVGVEENCPVVSPRADETALSSTGLEGKEFKSLGGVQSSSVKEQTALKALPSVPAVNEMFQQNSKILQLPVPSPFKQAINSASANSIESGSKVNEMAKELDVLLADIEQQGGFRDACTVAQRSLVLSLEEGLKKVSAKLRICKAKVEEHLQKIQQLQDKRMQGMLYTP